MSDLIRLAHDLAAELSTRFAERTEKLLALADVGEPPDVSQIHIRDLDAATPDELQAEIHRLDRRLRWMQVHYDNACTSNLLATYGRIEEDQAQRHHVAELERQRDAVLALCDEAERTAQVYAEMEGINVAAEADLDRIREIYRGGQ